MKLTDEELYETVNEVIDVLNSHMEGCSVDEGVANMQVVIGCIYEQMVKNIGHQQALMALGHVLQKAAAMAPPGAGVHVDMIRVPKSTAGKH